MSDGFDWGLTPRKPEPERAEPEEPEPEKPEPPKSEPPKTEQPEWEGEPTQAMPVNPAPVPPPLPTAPAYPPPQQFRPPSQYPSPTPPPLVQPPTQAMQPPTQAMRQPTPPTPPAWTQPPQPTTPAWEQHQKQQQPTTVVPVGIPDAAASGIDDIFGDHAFQEYDDGPLIGQIPLTRAPREPKAPAAPISRSQKTLMSVAGGLVAALALVAIYVAGTHIDLGADSEPVAVVTPPATPTPTETVVAGPVIAGTYEWNDLQGTECLEPFTNAWEQQYTVVDCDAPHDGQLTAKGTFDDSAAFPGAEALATQANLACASTKVINYKKAAVYDDIAISASYATTDQEWLDGFHDYYCFVNRTSGGPIAGTVSRAFGTAAG